MDVQFTIRREDAKRALRELQFGRGAEGKNDTAHILVSEFAATFRCVGTESEYPVHGISPGAACLPLRILASVIDTQSTKEICFRITDGGIFWGRAGVRNPAIIVGEIPDTQMTFAVDAPAFDLLVIERVIGMDGVVAQDLTSRLQKAHEALTGALERAAAELEPYNVTLADLSRLVEAALADAEPMVRASLSD